MIALLKEYGIRISATRDTLYQFTIYISTGEIKFDKIVEWLKKNTQAS